jgi:hypothetical protein
MSDSARSEHACPVCGRHTLALDQPPEIDVMGVQAYSDMLGMGDLPTQGAVGIVCLSCGTHWRDKEAFDRGESDGVVEPGVSDVEPSASDVDLGGSDVDLGGSDEDDAADDGTDEA